MFTVNLNIARDQKSGAYFFLPSFLTIDLCKVLDLWSIKGKVKLRLNYGKM